MLPFPVLYSAAITAEKDTVSISHSFESSVPFCLLHSPVTPQPFEAQGLSWVSMRPIPLTPLTVAVRTLNVSSSSRDLALATLCFMWAVFPSARFLRRFFEQMPSAFRSVSYPGVFYSGSCLRPADVLGTGMKLPPRLDFSIVDTFAYPRVPSEHCSSPRFGSHVFCGGGIPTLLPQARLPRETISLCWGASPPVDAVGRLTLLESMYLSLEKSCASGYGAP